jgi:G3E family GTPase
MNPLLLIVGFLGSGKTTFLRHVLPEFKARGLVPSVIINDYQNAWVDAALIAELAEAVHPISGSCVCCGSREELLDALAALVLTERSVVVVETNGTTDAEEIVEVLSLDGRTACLMLPMQLTLVDAKRWQKRYWHNGLERTQVCGASHLVFSRRDQVTSQRLDEVMASVLESNGRAKITSPSELAAELVTIVEMGNQMSPRTVRTIETNGLNSHPHMHHDPNQYHFAAMEAVLPPLVSEASLRRFLQELPAEVLRVKGLVVLKEFPDKVYSFQKVGGDDNDILLLPLRRKISFPPVAIFIGPSLPEDDIRACVAAL